MLNDFDQRIATLSTQLEERRASAEAALNQFFDVAASELSPILGKWAKEESRRQHAVLTALQVERVTALKGELEQTLAALPEYMRKWCNQDQFWAHRPKWRPPSTNTFYGYNVEPGSRRGPHLPPRDGSDRLDEVMNRGIRNLMSSLLEKYGFKFQGQGSHKFVMNSLDWTNAMNAAMNHYAKAYEDFAATQNELAKAKEEKGRHEAEELWNKA